MLAIGAGAIAGLTLLGGAAFAQTPSGTSTAAPQATATATAPSDGSQGGETQKDHTDCPHDQGGDQGGSSSGSNSSYRGA